MARQIYYVMRLIIVSGFDTHKGDSIGGFKLCTVEYVEIGRHFASMEIPALICREGGYNVDVLVDSAKNFLIGIKQ